MSLTQLEKAQRFRALHASGTFVIPNPFDGGAARVLAGLGFQALAHCRGIVAATDLRVSGELEKGYGDTPEAAADAVCRWEGLSLFGFGA